MGERTEADRWLQAYAGEHHFAATFEPDWEAMFGHQFSTNPDFLIESGGSQAVVECRGFKSWAFSEFMRKSRPQGGTVPPGVTRRPIFAALKEKAEQLEPFAVTGEPLVIALANTGTSDVFLDDHHMRSAMFGDLAVSIPIDQPGPANADLPPARTIVHPGYGAFCATDSVQTPCNPQPHVSGVAVVKRHDLYREFQRADLRRFIAARKPRDHEERVDVGTAWLETAVARGRGDGPSGFAHSVTYYDLGGYALGHGPPVPAEWFGGPRDRRFAFDSGGTNFALVRGDADRD